MKFDFSIINGETIENALDSNIQGTFDTIRDAYLLHHEGLSVNQSGGFLKFPENNDAKIIALPAYLGGRFNVSGIKWIENYPENIKKGSPHTSAVLILNDCHTGYPFICIEASIISEMRTAISAVLATGYINKNVKKMTTIGFVGNGFIAKCIIKSFEKIGWKFNRINLFDKIPEKSEKFLKQINQTPHKNISIKKSVNTLITQSDIVVFTTTALEPYVYNTNLFSHNPVVLNISLRDLSPEILLCSHNIVDDIEHVLHANTSPHLAYQKCGNKNFINGTLAALIKGAINLTRNKPIIFSPMGLDVLDLALGKFAYDYAVKNNLTACFDNFFIDNKSENIAV